MPDAWSKIFWRLFLAVFSLRCPFLPPESFRAWPWMESMAFSMFPQAEPAHKRVGVVTLPATGWELFQLLDVAPAQDHIVGFKSRDQAFHHIRNVRSPLLLTPSLQSSKPYVVFVGCLHIRKVAQFHGFDDAVHYHGRAESGSQ